MLRLIKVILFYKLKRVIIMPIKKARQSDINKMTPEQAAEFALGSNPTSDVEITKTLKKIENSIFRGKLDELEKLISQNPWIKTHQEAKDSLIHYTVLMPVKSKLKCIAKLIELGFDIEGKNEFEMTVLMLAASSGDSKCVEKLLELGASVDALDSLQRTGLSIATLRGHTDVVEILLKAGADPSLVDMELLVARLNDEGINLEILDLIKTAIIAWKEVTGKELSQQEGTFRSSRSYNIDLAKEHLEGRAAQVIKKLKKKVDLTPDESGFLNNPSNFKSLDRFKELEKLQRENADFIGAELFSKRIGEDMVHYQGFCMKNNS